MTDPTRLPPPTPALEAARALWLDAGLPPDGPVGLTLPGTEPVLPTSFAVATALQASLGAAAAVAARLGERRGGPPQAVRVAALDVVREASGFFRLDGQVPPQWDPLSGLYPCGDAVGQPGHVRIHANFAHHRDGVLGLLGLPPGPATPREAVAQALRTWQATAFEQAAADAGAVVAAARSFDAWDAHPHAAAVAAQPLVALDRIVDHAPQPLPPLPPLARPLQGLRVLDLTRILAGPVAGRTLAAWGADVLLVNGPHLPNIASIAETSRGKRSALVDLRTPSGRETLRDLVRTADVFLQGYRPGALAAWGFAADDLQRLRPGLVCVGLSAYGDAGPWGGRRGFDSLVQTATGFNLAEARAFGTAEPKALPLQALDYAAGFLLAFGTLAALHRRATSGGGHHVRVSLARTGLWLRSLGRTAGFEAVGAPDVDRGLETTDTGFGRLEAVPHAARFDVTPAAWSTVSMPPGRHPPAWLPRAC